MWHNNHLPHIRVNGETCPVTVTCSAANSDLQKTHSERPITVSANITCSHLTLFPKKHIPLPRVQVKRLIILRRPPETVPQNLSQPALMLALQQSQGPKPRRTRAARWSTFSSSLLLICLHCSKICASPGRMTGLCSFTWLSCSFLPGRAPLLTLRLRFCSALEEHTQP